MDVLIEAMGYEPYALAVRDGDLAEFAFQMGWLRKLNRPRLASLNPEVSWTTS